MNWKQGYLDNLKFTLKKKEAHVILVLASLFDIKTFHDIDTNYFGQVVAGQGLMIGKELEKHLSWLTVPLV